jgi:BNR/Asp-box repeat
MTERHVMRILVPVLAGLALAASALSPAAAADGGSAARPGPAAAVARSVPPIPPNIDVSQQLGNHAEDAIAANPDDPQNVVAMSMRGNLTHGLFAGVTFDGGRTWSRRVIGRGWPLGKICCDEDLAWDRNGNLWLSYLVRPDFDPVIAVSTDGGLTFTKVTKVIPTPWKVPGHSATRGLQFAADQPHIAVGRSSVWVSFTALAFTPKTIVGVKVEASGAHVSGLGRFGRFIRAEKVPTLNAMGDYGDTAVGPHGQVMVIYSSNLATRCCSRIYTAVDPDGLGPRRFGQPRLLARSDVGGFYAIPAQPQRGVYDEPKLAWDYGPGRYHGRVYAVWTQATPKLSDNLNIMFRYSDDGGRTWTKARRLGGPRTAGSQFFQAIAVDQATGYLAVGWYDCRNARGQGGAGCRKPDSYAQFWAAISTDGGRTFKPAFQVSRGTSNSIDSKDQFEYGDYTHLAFQSHLLYPAWSDNSDSPGNNPNGTLHGLDLYLAVLYVP